MRLAYLSLLSLAASLLVASTAAAQTYGADEDALHARIVAELRARDPAAADAFDRARRGDYGLGHDEALRLYEEVERRVPDASHGYRAHSHMIVGDDARAVELARRAVELDRSAIDLASLSISLSGSDAPTPAQLDEAAALADEAVTASPEEPWGYSARLAAAVANGRDTDARSAAAELERVTDPRTAAHGLAAGAWRGLFRAPEAEPPPLARELLERATALAPDDEQVSIVQTMFAMQRYDAPAALAAARRAVDVSPASARAHAVLAAAYATNGEYEAAQRALDTAHERGLPDGMYEDVASSISLQRSFVWIVLAVIVGAPVGAYVGTILFLLLAGWALSRLTLRAAARLPTETSGRAVGMAAWLRWTYRAVLWLCCAFYYASLPLIVIGMILLVVGVFLAFLAIGIVPIKLMFIVGLAALVTIGAILKSLFVRVRDEDPGPRLDVAAHPRFAALLEEVAARVRTRRVDSVFLTPGTEIAVTERGGFFRQLRRKTDRTLILGIGVLEGMSTQELKAILAHEHGHFRNEDTAGGSFALAARRSLMLMAIGLVQGGVASKLNPAWWFTLLFSKVFARISQGASRLQEVLADRWAAYAYGSDAFVSGLRHVIAASVRFDARAKATLQEVVDSRAPLANFYRYTPAQADDADAIERAIEEELTREPTAYDSHPAPRDRIAWVSALASSGEGSPDPSEAWSVFTDREALERLLTAEIRHNLAVGFGVSIPDGSEVG